MYDLADPYLNESLQPYKAGDDEAIKCHHLFVLHKLCNIDKHIRIPAYGADLRWKLPKEIFHSASFEDADELGRGVLSIPLRLKQYMVLEPAPSFRVLFGDAFYRIECDIENFQRIYDFVADDVIPRFARLS